MMKSFLMFCIRFYQIAISSWMPPTCRHYPSCSAYARQAIHRFGAWQGGWMACKRICTCHPFGKHGVDVVPTVSQMAKDKGRMKSKG